MKCIKCGTELTDDTKFCSYCGKKVEILIDDVNNTEDTSLDETEEFIEDKIPADNDEKIKNPISDTHSVKNSASGNSLSDKWKKKLSEFWNKMDLFCQIETVAIVAATLLLIIAICVGKVLPILFSVLQVAGLVVALFMHKGIIKVDKKWLKYLILVVAILISLLNIKSYSWFNNANTTKVSNNATMADTPYSAVECEGKEYSTVKNDFMIAGFYNISEEIIEDLDITEMDREGLVESVSINGIEDFNNNTEYKSSAKVVIVYHSFKSIEVPVSSEEVKSMDAEMLMSMFADAGFVEISTVEEYDLDPDVTEVEFENHISINGTKSFDKGDTFPINADIKIITHKPYEKYTLKVVVDFVPNLLFNKYDVEFEIDGQTETLSHGEDTELEFRLKPDVYTLTFFSAESETIKGSVELEVNGDTEASYKIYCYSDNISVEKLYVENEGAVGKNEAMVPYSASDCKFENYKDIENAFSDAGFTNISTSILYDIVIGWTEEGEVEQVTIDGKTDFTRGDIFAKDAAIIITYHMKEEDDPNKPVETTDTEKNIIVESETENVQVSEREKDTAVFYSSNDYETAKKGNTGVFSYRYEAGSYDIYWIIDFDEGYVYYFTEGNGESTCDRLKIESGDLNSNLVITYHDGGYEWSYGLHFKYVNHPETLIMIDNNGFDYKYSTTDLDDALSIRNTKSIKDY